jgi:arylsulfatase A-like enzyme
LAAALPVWSLSLLALLLVVVSDLSAQAPSPARPNVVVVFIDTLRADHVHCLGYERETTPSFDSVAAGGTLFETAIAPSSWSLPCYASIFSSLYPPAHGVDELRQYFDKSFLTLPKILGTYGYDTAGFVGGGHLSRIFGLDNGFELYLDQPHFGSFYHTVPEALKWIDRPRDGPFFALIQGYDLHAPYQPPLGFAELYDPDYRGPIHDLKVLTSEVLLNITNNVLRRSRPDAAPERLAAAGTRTATDSFSSAPLDVATDARLEHLPLTEADRRHLVAHYDGALTYADSWLGVLVEELRVRSLLENTLLVVAGDHGESLGEHGYYGHRVDLYDEQLRVPLLFSGPGIEASRRVTQVVELVDLAPTLLDLCSIPPCREFQGRSLAAAVRKGSAPPPIDENRAAFSSLNNRLSVRTSRWHLIHFSTGKTQLFDLAADPTEQTDVGERHPELTRGLLGRALDWYERYRREPRGTGVTLTPDEKAMFKQRGYW